MTPDEQRIAIARACGWTDVGLKVWDMCHPLILMGVPPGSTKHEVVPDYFNDLDAMFEAEEWLTEGMFDDYVAELMDLMHHEHMANEPEFRLIRAVHASADRRAKAYVNLLNRNKAS